MKKYLIILALTILTLNNNAKAAKYGEGDLQLTNSSAYNFIRFIHGKYNKHPSDFYISLDGTYTSYWTCSYTRCNEGDLVQDINHCERKSEKKCAKFAFRRTVKWKNGINPAKGKASTFNSKWSDAKIYAKLTELGFYKNDTVKKTENLSSDIIKQIKELKKLVDEGILTNEEFVAAKKKLLN